MTFSANLNASVAGPSACLLGRLLLEIGKIGGLFRISCRTDSFEVFARDKLTSRTHARERRASDGHGEPVSNIRLHLQKTARAAGHSGGDPA
jgi:hypothetical protein